MDTGLRGWEWRSPTLDDIRYAGADRAKAFRKALQDIEAGKASVTLAQLDQLAQEGLTKAQDECILFASLRAEVQKVHDPIRQKCILCNRLIINDSNAMRTHLHDDHNVSYTITDGALDNTFTQVKIGVDKAS